MEEVLKEAYGSNFGSAYETYKESVTKDNSIRLQDVKNYLNKRDDIQVESKPRGSNSFVSPGARFEFEIDIMDILARDGGESVGYAMVAIDNFTKIAEVTPIENRQPIELIPASKIKIRSMGTPKQLYPDEESSFRAKVFFRFMNDNDTEHVQTSTHAPSVERFIRTFKGNLYRRLDGLKQNKSDWVKHVKNIVTKNNNTEHNTTNIKPLDAVKKGNHLWVNWHLQNNATKARKYPKINEGDMVRVNIKKNKLAKGHEPNWSSTKYEVVAIKGNQ